MGIILEDDCLPSHSFFGFVRELLSLYKLDQRISGIIGTNFSGVTTMADSYFFSRIFIGWGWATWRNRWQHHLQTLDNFNSLKSNELITHYINSDTALRHIFRYAEDSVENRMDAWDFQFHLSSLLANGLFIIPCKNLVYYDGYGLEATHTKSSDQTASRSYSIAFPLKHPFSIVPNKQFDNFHFKNKMGYVDSHEKISPRHIWGVIKKRVNNFA